MQESIRVWRKQLMCLATLALAAVTITARADSQTVVEGPSLNVPTVLTQQPEALPVPPEPTPQAAPAEGESTCGCKPVCCYNPCIKYRGEHKLKRFCCGCECPTFETVTITVQDPANCGCSVDIPICMPTCCKGEPCIDSRCGLFDRGVVWLKWCCGFKVRVLLAGDGCKGRNVIVSYHVK